MNRIQSIAFACTLIFTFAMLSCNDPLQIGAELVEDADVQFVTTDTVTVEAITTQRDSVTAYRAPDFILGNQKLGWIADPIFGDHKSELFIQLFQESFSTRPEGQVDSVVLVVRYDTSGIYGDPNTTFDFEVSSVEEQVSPFEIYYTDDVLTRSTTWGTVNGFNVVGADSIEVIEIDDEGELDTLQVPNQMRIVLNNELGNLLMNIDSSNYTSADSFVTAFSGLLIRPTTPSGSMMSLLSGETDNTGVVRGLRANKVSVFYRNTENEPRQYDYFLGGAAFTMHNHDYSTGSIDGAIDNALRGRDLLYVQGAGGPVVSVKFPHIQSLNGVVVNEAILEITTELLPEDDRSKYPLPAQMYTAYEVESLLVLTSDIAAAAQGFRDVSLYGGQPVEVSGSKIVYKFNLSDHIQSMIEGTSSDEIFIRISENSNGVQRAIFKGINDPDSPIKLNITYTEI